MSSEESKVKHSSRRHKTDSAINKQVKIAKSRYGPIKEPHRWHKMRALNCGQPNCVFCKNPRRDGYLTIQERRLFQAQEEE